MRIAILAVIAVLTLPAASMAQDRRAKPSGHAAAPRDPVPRWTIPPRSGPASEGWPRDPVPTWAITPRHGRSTQGVPLPPIGLQPRGHRNKSPRIYGGSFYVPWYAWPIYGVPAIAETYVQSAPVPEPVPTEPPVSSGRFVLDVQPGTTQVFADGYYVGTSVPAVRCAAGPSTAGHPDALAAQRVPAHRGARGWWVGDFLRACAAIPAVRASGRHARCRWPWTAASPAPARQRPATATPATSGDSRNAIAVISRYRPQCGCQ